MCPETAVCFAAAQASRRETVCSVQKMAAADPAFVSLTAEQAAKAYSAPEIQQAVFPELSLQAEGR